MTNPVRITVIDPVDGTTFQCRPETAGTLVELSKRHRMPIWEIYKLVRVALFGIEAWDDNWYPERECDRLQHDNYGLRHWKGVLGIDGLLAIRERAMRAIARHAERETDPVKRSRLEAMLKPTPEWEHVQERTKSMIAQRHRSRTSRKGMRVGWR